MLSPCSDSMSKDWEPIRSKVEHARNRPLHINFERK
jgi:hypothetical protein